MHSAPEVLGDLRDRQSATKIDDLAKRTNDQATDIEGACESPPRVGNVQAAATYQRAYYDWTQTRFEDLMASGAHLAALAGNLRASADTYARCDADAEQLLIKILDELANPADGTGH